MPRIRPIPSQERRLLDANGHRCCVCKRSNVGLHLHHIDSDSSNTIDANLAVLCVEHHDQHHRPGKYAPATNHLELGSSELLKFKTSWESFLVEARQSHPQVLATLTMYGTSETIHSMELVMQWPDERIEFVRAFHLREGTPDQLTTAIIHELSLIGPNLKLAVVDGPQPTEHCSCCGTGVSHTMKPAVVARLTDPDWSTKSICAIYINPERASLALTFALAERELFSGSLHLCNGKYLHYSSEGIDEQIELKDRPSVRKQATHIVEQLLKEWQPAHVIIGTGDETEPEIVKSLNLPNIWEKRMANSTDNRTLRDKTA